eukprot:gnl/MRDRNA2_/MRDRNA2_172306_c0_seq1.p1 gnl/MRDRNA2_/MRDRNA2_172306_c0~~gnl/MRDRNA2_/MRDRNA2_172306_c0_seq1.p1  ORF type:complete len:276 (+),score=44.39 gnl/MRDRNA2_/MRDRNA2_172306_c0_seq1:133-960(+)
MSNAVTQIILLACVAHGRAEQLRVNPTDKSFAGLVRRVVKVQSLHHTDVDSVTIAKPGHILASAPKSNILAPNPKFQVSGQWLSTGTSGSWLSSACSRILLPAFRSPILSFRSNPCSLVRTSAQRSPNYDQNAWQEAYQALVYNPRTCTQLIDMAKQAFSSMGRGAVYADYGSELQKTDTSNVKINWQPLEVWKRTAAKAPSEAAENLVKQVEGYDPEIEFVVIVNAYDTMGASMVPFKIIDELEAAGLETFDDRLDKWMKKSGLDKSGFDKSGL